LESERTQWEQRYLEETAMRQVAIDAASIPKDAKIAALEKTSAESEKLIADARNDKMRQFEDMQNAQVRKNNLFYFLSQKIRQITAHTHCYFTRLKSKEIGPF
jgi:DNA helicase IV